jgi:hypothetical protein
MLSAEFITLLLVGLLLALLLPHLARCGYCNHRWRFYFERHAESCDVAIW